MRLRGPTALVVLLAAGALLAPAPVAAQRMRGASKASMAAATEPEPVPVPQPEPEPKLVVDPAPKPPVVPQPKPVEEAAPAQPIAVGEPATGQKKPPAAQQPSRYHHHHHLDLEQRHGHAHGHGQGQEAPAPPATATTVQPAPPKPAVAAQGEEEEDVEAEEYALQQPKARPGQSLRDYLVEHTMLEREQHASGVAAPMEPIREQQGSRAASPAPIVTNETLDETKDRKNLRAQPKQQQPSQPKQPAAQPVAQEQPVAEKQQVQAPAPEEPAASSSGGLRGANKEPTTDRNLEEGKQASAPEASTASAEATGSRLRGATAPVQEAAAPVREEAAAAPGVPSGGLRGAAKAAAAAAADALAEGVEEAVAAAQSSRLRGKGMAAGAGAAAAENIETSAAVEEPGHGCTGGRVWSECARPCDATCEVPRPICAAVCTQRCHCPASRPIWNGERCIEESLCPPLPAANALPAARSSLRGSR